MDVQPTQGCFVKLFGDNQANNIPGLQVHTPSDKHVNRQNPNLGYIINLEQPDSMSQIVQLNQGQGNTLDVYSSINQNMKPQKLDNTVLLKNVNNTNRKDEVVVLKPLGSCENPIEIIKDGELLHSTQNLSPEYLQQIAQALQLNVKSEEQKEMENAPPNIFYRVVYPDELNLKPIPIKPLKRGRKKKQPMNEEKDIKEIIVPPKLVKGFRTRSGRVTRPPQHIKNDFKKIDTSESDSLDMNGDLKTTDFESPNVQVVSEPVHITLPEDRLETHKRKRSISSQFRCPECKKAYLGNNKMLRHFEKHPEHRPKSDYYKARYDDTWNYLMDISNKNPVGQRGIKFCRELVNLLNNVKIVAKSFFKTPIDSDKNLFLVDSTLSDVLGIEPGNYALNESKLHKEVQVLLPCSTNGQDNNIKLIADTNFDMCESKDSFNENGDTYDPSNNISEPSSTIDSLNFNHSTNGFNLNCDMSTKGFSFSESFGEKEKDLKPLERNKQPELSLHNELLSENSLLNSLPNLRNSVEELILHDNGQDTVMLDNSTSSDEVMNVDQFVNERLKNLTESDLALPNSLNLDLPSLDLFQFHTS